jgi:hypothetical protein
LPVFEEETVAMSQKLDVLQKVLTRTKHEIAKVIIGQEDVVDMALIAIFTGQHALIEGVPGVAKTLLVRTLAHILGCEFNRIQFTPDLMPADITGTNVFNLKENTFDLMKGPVFTTFLLADEINRAPAKTQSALLQAMQERAVTIDRETHILDANFTVFATQNPVEYQGTYPLAGSPERSLHAEDQYASARPRPGIGAGPADAGIIGPGKRPGKRGGENRADAEYSAQDQTLFAPSAGE